MTYLKMFGALIIFFLYIWYTVRLYKNMLKSSNVELKVLMKILINQLQQNAIITLLDMNYGVEIEGFYGIMQVKKKINFN